MQSLLSLFFLLIFATTVCAEIVFEDSFDGHADWSSEVTYNTDSVWPETIQTILDGPASSSNLPAWYNYRCGSASNTTGEPLYVVDDDDPHGGSGKSLRYNLENASYMNGGSINAVLCNSATCGYDELYIRFYMKLEPDFDMEDGGSDFIKLFRLYTGVDVVNDTMGPSSTYATNDDYNASPQIKRSSLIVVYLVIDGNGDYRLSYEYETGQQVGVDWEYEQEYVSESVFNFKDYLGQWIYFELKAKLNTVGQEDGEIEVWIMPESDIGNYNVNAPTATWGGLPIRTTNDRKWNALILADNMSGEWERGVDEQTLTYDDLVISADPVGPTYEIGDTATCYPDIDGDLYPGTGSESVTTCTTNWYIASHFTSMSNDCDDTDEDINPGLGNCGSVIGGNSSFQNIGTGNSQIRFR